MPLLLTCLFILALALSSAPTQAATPEQLHALRDRVVPDTCASPGDPSLGPISQTQLGTEKRLYLVPCRTTFANVLSVVILERPGRLSALVFPAPGFSFGETWEDARMNRITVTMLLHSPVVTPEGELVSSERIPPGLGTGYILRRYAFEDASPVLKQFAIELDDRKPIELWDDP